MINKELQKKIKAINNEESKEVLNLLLEEIQKDATDFDVKSKVKNTVRKMISKENK